MRTPLVAGNWKMHGSRRMAEELIGDLLRGLAPGRPVDVLVCPPFVYLPEAAALLQKSPIALGAQNVADEPEGAYTGEISPAMLADCGCTHVIVGHSERRTLYAETDDKIAQKFLCAQQADLIPVLCVGETLDERERGITEGVIARQLQTVIDRASIAAFSEAVIAYEPVWAIGTGKTATPEQVQEVHSFIRNLMAGGDDKMAQSLRILYGGSVNSGNAAEIFIIPDVDGGLIGGASLKADEFLKICDAAG